MLMGAGEAQRFRKTGILRTPSIKRPPKELLRRCKLPRVARLMARRVSTTAPRSARRRVVTSTRQRTAIPTRTPEAAGRALVEAQTDTAAQVTTPKLLRAGEDRKRAADPRHSAAAEAADGNPERPALGVRKAWAVGVAGAAAAVAAAGEPDGAAANDVELVLWGSFLQSNFGGSLCRAKPAESLLRPG